MKPTQFFRLSAALALVPVLTLSAHAPEVVTVQSISYGGTGTPQGTVGQSISDDRKTFTLIFDSFIASSGPGVPLTEGSKNSQINLQLNGPGKALLTGTLRGYVQLPAGATALVTASFADPKVRHGDTQVLTTNFVGPLSQDYLLTGDFEVKGTTSVFTDTLNLEISISSPAGTQAQITVDSTDGQLAPRQGSNDDDD